MKANRFKEEFNWSIKNDVRIIAVRGNAGEHDAMLRKVESWLRAAETAYARIDTPEMCSNEEHLRLRAKWLSEGTLTPDQWAESFLRATPQAIMDEITALDAESAEVLGNIKALL
jgi:hypothetical protein